MEVDRLGRGPEDDSRELSRQRFSLPTGNRRLDRLDASLIAVIAVVAYLFAIWFLPAFRAGGGEAIFYQAYFAPGAMLACGHGYTNADPGSAPPLKAFLDVKTEALRCEDVPASLAPLPLTPFQGGHRYLISTAALIWRVAGIRWSALDVLAAALYAAALAGAYAAARFVCGRVLSLLAVLVWAVSPLHLALLPNIRDYSKAPFFVAMLIAIGIVIRERRTVSLVALGLVFGAVEGVGFGMRTDVILNIVPFLIVLFAVSSERVLNHLSAKLACATATVGMFAVIAAPAAMAYRAESNWWHVATLGLTVPFNKNLGLKPAAYDFGDPFLDGYVEAGVSNFWTRAHGSETRANLGTAAYTRAGREYFTTLVQLFPGDAVARTIAAAFRDFNIPFHVEVTVLPVSNVLLTGAIRWRAALLAWFEGAGLIAFALILVLLGIERLSYAFIAFVLLFGWAAYPVIQYEGRHVFHLELPALLLAAAVPSSWRRLMTAVGADAIGDLRVRGVRAVAFTAALFATLPAALVVARMAQTPRVRALFESYVEAPTELLTAMPSPLDGARVRFTVDPFRGPTLDYGADEAIVVVDVDAGRCSSERVDVRFHYDDTVPDLALDFSRTVDVPLGPAGTSTRVLFPAYALYRKGRVVSRLAGIDVPRSAVDCLHVGRIRDLSALGSAPLLNVTLTPDWRRGPLYQQISPGGVLPMPLWRPILHWWRG